MTDGTLVTPGGISARLLGIVQQLDRFFRTSFSLFQWHVTGHQAGLAVDETHIHDGVVGIQTDGIHGEIQPHTWRVKDLVLPGGRVS